MIRFAKALNQIKTVNNKNIKEFSIFLSGFDQINAVYHLLVAIFLIVKHIVNHSIGFLCTP